mmetsp:Transcript_29255/g.79138  ORF Transcript_29255/g.79138 Transcript_29255/m.79138 type:complete len:424 (+) Transcript_29255:160-1431(+)
MDAINDLSSEALLSLGDSHHVDNNYDEAVDAYAAALSLFRESEVSLQIRTLSHRSSAFYKLKRYENALEDALKALELLSTNKPSGIRTGEGEICHRRAGLASFQLEQFQTAKENLQMAEQLASLNQRHTNKQLYTDLLKKCDAALSHPTQTSIDASPSTEENTPKTPTAPSVTPKPVAPAPALAGTRGKTPRYQYYQSDKVMTISILEAGVKDEDLTVEFEPKYLIVILRKNGTDFTVIAGNLYSEIDVTKSKVVIKDEKVLVKLRKVEHYEWHELLGKADDSSGGRVAKKKSPEPAENGPKGDATDTLDKKISSVSVDSNKPRPYAGHRDWDAIEKNIEEDEKKEKPEGDEAMNQLFKQIYANANEDTRRAMVKSFQTSGGTVLSTNWDEVKNKDYENERTAPKGVEWKTWDGEKVPMKEDD